MARHLGVRRLGDLQSLRDAVKSSSLPVADETIANERVSLVNEPYGRWGSIPEHNLTR